MAVIPNFKGRTLIAFLKQNVAPGTTVYTDGLKTFTGLREAGFKHVTRSQPLRIELRKGHEIRGAIGRPRDGNLQQWLIGTYDGVSRDQLQIYLDEFVFRHNRRGLPMAAFQTCLVWAAAASRPPITRYVVQSIFLTSPPRIKPQSIECC
jgi:transposase-like protein